MASIHEDKATGITIDMATSGFTGTITNIGSLPHGFSREAEDSTNQGSAEKEYSLADIVDASDLELEGFHNPAVSTAPSKTVAEELITITLPSGKALQFWGGATEFKPGAELDKLFKFTMTIKKTRGTVWAGDAASTTAASTTAGA